MTSPRAAGHPTLPAVPQPEDGEALHGQSSTAPASETPNDGPKSESRGLKRKGSVAESRKDPLRLSKVRSSDIVAPFQINKRDLGQLDLNEFEGRVSEYLDEARTKAKKKHKYAQWLYDVLEKDKFEDMWPKTVAGSAMRNRLIGSIDNYGSQSEMWARKVIDCFLDGMTNGPHSRRIVVVPELDLAKKKQTKAELIVVEGLRAGRSEKPGDKTETMENPGRIEKGGACIEVTGSVDYMIVTSPLFDSSPDLHTKARDTAENLDRATALLNLANMKRTNILLVEAKRMDTTVDVEARNHPQVLAQAHLSMRKTQRDDLAWVLSDGDTWVFGLSHIKDDNWNAIFFEPPPLYGDWRAERLRYPRERDAQFEKRQSLNEAKLMLRAKTIFRMLTFWTYTLPDHLWRFFNAETRS